MLQYMIRPSNTGIQPLKNDGDLGGSPSHSQWINQTVWGLMVLMGF